MHLGPRSYDIIVGSSVIKRLPEFLRELSIGTDAYVITNPVVMKLCGRRLFAALRAAGCSVRYALIADTEKSKSLATVMRVIRGLAAYDRNKRIFIAALGGGVVGDCAGFIASVYKRGIPYIQIPTTLLAQVDSSIGGKTAVDLPEGKNLVGSFYQPRLVISDVSCTASLPARQIKAGLAEVIKYGVIKDSRLFVYLEENAARLLHADPDALRYVISLSSAIKAAVAEEDEREEKSIRTILNFGHTVGHAIEAAGDYRRHNHGEAIALGMLVAADISRRLGMVSDDACIRIEKLIAAFGLPTAISGVRRGDIINAHYRDKKFIGSRNRFVLITGIGKTRIVEDVPYSVITAAIKERTNY